jgi:hypothetical protein
MQNIVLSNTSVSAHYLYDVHERLYAQTQFLFSVDPSFIDIVEPGRHKKIERHGLNA